jgi:hypothetical protein
MTIKTGEAMLAADLLNMVFFPRGAILSLSGSAYTALDSKVWKVCNAANHAVDPFVPDLSDKFIKGSGSLPDIGGSNRLIATMLPGHTHGLSAGSAVSGGSHGHEFYGGIRRTGITTDPAGQDKYILWNRWIGGIDYTGASAHGDSEILAKLTATHAVQQGGAHTHSLFGSTNNDNSSTTDNNTNNMPLYYSVIYIIKVTDAGE